MEVVSHHDLDGNYAFQSQLYKSKEGKYYLYFGCYRGTGVEILDVTDPQHPRTVRYMQCVDPQQYPYMATPKIQICDDLMVVSVGNCIPFLHGAPPVDNPSPVPGGVKLYSLKDNPENPRFLSYWKTGVEGADMGVHRFTYNGGRYLHLTAGAPGFAGLIYRIVDIADPTAPIEVGRWWLPGQFLGNQTEKTRKEKFHGWSEGSSYPGFVHFVYAVGDRAYLSCVGAGFKILDISDVRVPQLIGEVNMCPPFAGKFGGALCHTFMPILGTNYAVGLQEGERFWMMSEELQNSEGIQEMRGIELFDISDPTDPVMISVFPYPEVPQDYPYKNFNYCGLTKPGPFGPHNIHEPMTNKPWIENRSDRIYNCYFHAGMRVYDVSDPYVPKEIAYFIPPAPQKLCWEQEMANPPLGTAEDCVVDDRGYIYMNAMHDGVYVLKCLV